MEYVVCPNEFFHAVGNPRSPLRCANSTRSPERGSYKVAPAPVRDISRRSPVNLFTEKYPVFDGRETKRVRYPVESTNTISLPENLRYPPAGVTDLPKYDVSED
jgi:hypothetical protein